MWEIREHIDVPECVERFAERGKEFIEDAATALKEGSAELFHKAKEAYLGARTECMQAYGEESAEAAAADGIETSPEYYLVELEHYRELMKQETDANMRSVYMNVCLCLEEKLQGG